MSRSGEIVSEKGLGDCRRFLEFSTLHIAPYPTNLPFLFGEYLAAFVYYWWVCFAYTGAPTYKAHSTKNFEYKTGFKEIPVPFNRDIFRIQQWKVPPDNGPLRMYFMNFTESRERFVVLLPCRFFLYRYAIKYIYI